jgi:hypothetical protein
VVRLGRGLAEIGDRQPDAALEGGLVGDDPGQGVTGSDPGIDRGERARGDGRHEVVGQEVVTALMAVGGVGELLRQPGAVVDGGRSGREGVAQSWGDVGQ